MASGVDQRKVLVIGPAEPWSVREKLCLAASVMKSGDQNWISVSRAIKPFAESGRPPDWFSQKHCASQYSELLETTEAPKRKRGEKGDVLETVKDVIVRKLTAERIEELKKLIKETQEKHRKLKREAQLIQAGHLDSKLEEIWQEIVQKKKLMEEEAELKRKTTDAAYQARQVAKNTPKRVPSLTMHSPSDCTSPNQEFSPGDSLECLTLDFASTKNVSASCRSLPLAKSSGPGKDEVGGHGLLLDDSTQKKVLGQRATPPPSPLLSELLKKGSLLTANANLIGESSASSGHITSAHDFHLPGLPASQTTGAPMLSRLLEANPAQFSAPLGLMSSADCTSSAPPSAVSPVPVDSTASASTGNVMVSFLPAGDTAESAVEKVLELSDEDVTVAYMGDELDLKTVGDIIAIIEDKVDESAEALDAAAVEAALSLCEENVHTLSGSWPDGPFQPNECHPSVPTGGPQSLSGHSTLVGKAQVQGRTSAPHSSLCNSRDNCFSAYSLEIQGPSPTSSSSLNSMSLEHCQTAATAQPLAKRETKESMHQGSQISWGTPIKRGKTCENCAQGKPDNLHKDSVLEDSPVTERHPKEVKAEHRVSAQGEQNASETKADLEVAGPEVYRRDEDGVGVDAFLSEPDGEAELEPAASESEDGYSLRTASSSLQLHTTTDSIPSSPASSQFSVCSEDQEALQAHKIWKKAIMLVWRAAANHRYANVFLQPVTDEIAPGYHSIVQRPMDLATIKKNIETGLIRTTAEFQRDIMLMFHNAVMYNSLDHDVYHMALEMQRDVLEQVQQFLATQLIMETSESGISTKSLRGRESTRKQDTTEKDAVSMSSPAFLLSLFDRGTRGRRCAIEADLKMKK